MRLRQLWVKGYRGVSHDRPMKINDLGHRNVFIGANNAGKSTALRFVCAVARIAHKAPAAPTAKGALFEVVGEPGLFDENWWWKHNTTIPVEGEFAIRLEDIDKDRLASDSEFLARMIQPESQEPELPGRLIVDDEWRLHVSMRTSPQQRDRVIKVAVAPMVLLGGHWRPLVRLTDRNEFKHQNATGNEVAWSSDVCPYHEPALRLMKAWAESTFFFDPVRALDRSHGRRQSIDGSEDGSSVVRDFFISQRDGSKPSEHAELVHWVCAELNSLLVPQGVAPLEHFDVKESARTAAKRKTGDVNAPDNTPSDPEVFLKFKSMLAPIPLHATGTGLSELFILFSKLARAKLVGGSAPKQVFIEEPEAHLHPGLVRRLMNKLDDYPDTQFFLTTHSSAIIDSLTSKDRVYRFFQGIDGGSLVEQAATLVDMHSALDSIGISGSQLLQANCLIWVEGPSDRIYVRYWLTRTAVSRGINLVEGVDFAFAFYGGKLLKHFALSYTDDSVADDGVLSQADEVRLLFVNRFSAVIMDRDLPRGTADDNVRTAKQQILAAVKFDPKHRRAYLTLGREIENDIQPTNLLACAAAKLLNYPIPATVPDIMQDIRKYDEELVSLLNVPVDRQEKARKSIRQKVSFATAVIEEATSSGVPILPPPYLADLFDFIVTSRYPEEIR